MISEYNIQICVTDLSVVFGPRDHGEYPRNRTEKVSELSKISVFGKVVSNRYRVYLRYKATLQTD